MPQRKQSGKSLTPKFRRIRRLHAITEYELACNGLRVLYMPVPGSGIVTSNLVYRVGSRHEKRGETGIAHMLEHMLFKAVHDGTGKKSTVLAHQLLEEKGAFMNASTWLDRTNYYFTLPVEYFSDALGVEAARMRNLLIEQKEFVPEQTNVLSEYEMYAGIPREALGAEIVQAAFISHGYGHETIGLRTDIERYTVSLLRDFYDTYYWPNNATLTVVGDVSEKEMLDAVYAKWKFVQRSPHPIPEVSIVEPVQKADRHIVLRRKSPLNIYARAFITPPAKAKEWALLLLIKAYLTHGTESRLEKRMIDTHKASSVDISMSLTHDKGLMIAYVQLAQKTTHADIADILDTEIALLAKKPLSVKLLDVLKTKLRAEEMYSRDGTSAISRELTEHIAAGDWTRYYTLIEDIDNATAVDIQRAAQTYLLSAPRITGYFEGI